jgi:hypothetical protein
MSSAIRLDLPPAAWRALHSKFLDYLLAIDPDVSGALMRRLDGQLSFEHFMLAIHSTRVLEPHVRLDEAADCVIIGLGVPVNGGNRWVLFTMPGGPYGVTPAWTDAAGMFRLDEELSEILGGEV